MKDINRLNNGSLTDYIIFCDTCGAPCWKSEATLLKSNTGLGGSLVCPRDVDAIDYSLIPWKIKAERSVPVVRINNLADSSNIYNARGSITDFNSTNINIDPDSSTFQTIDAETIALIGTHNSYLIGN